MLFNFKKVFKPQTYPEANPYIQEEIARGVNPGVFCTKLDEPIPDYNGGACEKVYQGYNNSFIVLGRDRNESLSSGAGGGGLSACGSIDLVTGRGAVFSSMEGKPIAKDTSIGPSFSTDAARVYITQKSLGIDGYFGLTAESPDLVGPSYEKSYMKSAIGLKADHIRVIGREEIKLYCGGANWKSVNGGRWVEHCSNGDKLSSPKIKLIAGNEERLQPTVLGDNLAEYLIAQNKLMTKTLNKISKIWVALAEISMNPTFPMPQNIKRAFNEINGNLTTVINEHLNTFSYLDKGLLKGGKTILSNSVYIT